MMLSKKSLVRTGAGAFAVALFSAGAVMPVAADQSHDNAKRPANAQANHERAHQKRAAGAERVAQAKAQKRSRPDGGDRNTAPNSQGQGDERGDGHTPVTLCHVLGNGGYNMITVDGNAEQAHLGHGDKTPTGGVCPAAPAGDGPETGNDNGQGSGNNNGGGHDPVTVCHVLGNGGYIKLTFDDDALDAHMAHGDVEWDGTGCPTGDTGGDTGGFVTRPGGTETGTDTDTVVAGVQKIVRTNTVDSAQVAGVEQVAGVNAAPAPAAPLAGILPATGAAQVGLAGLAGLTLLGGGAALMARRRSQLG